MNIKTKLILLVIAGVVTLGAATIRITASLLEKEGLAEIKNIRSLLIDQRQIMLENLVDNAVRIIELKYTEAQNEGRSGNEADVKEKIALTIDAMRYGENKKDYFYILCMDTQTVRMHPKKEFIGKKITSDEFRDPDGELFLVKQMDAARDNKQGFDYYRWEKLGFDEPVSKMTFYKVFKEWNWVVATGVYMDDIEAMTERNRENIEAGVSRMTLMLSLLTMGVCSAIIIIAVFVAQRIGKTLKEAGVMFRDISEGEADLTQRLEIHSKDEIADMAHSFNIFIGKLQQMIQEIAEKADTLNSASEEMTELSRHFSSGADYMLMKSNTVAAATEELSSGVESIAEAMSHASSNINTVVTSTEEMAVTVTDIAEQSEKARRITGRAVEKAMGASERVQEFGEAAKDIEKVTETIIEISDQTKLLALNATIEAARAGEAGKGFAVVANEIKELARNTALASQDIRKRIEGILNSIRGAVAEIIQITDVINEISDIVSVIAAAVDQQSVNNKDAAKSVSDISMGIRDVNQNLNQSSTVFAEIARDIGEVNEMISNVSKTGAHIDAGAETLSETAESLRSLVFKFKVK